MRVGRHVKHNLYDDQDVCIGHMHTDEAAQDLVNMVDARVRTLEALQQVIDRKGPGGLINATQVKGLLSLTWPDGNYCDEPE